MDQDDDLNVPTAVGRDAADERVTFIQADRLVVVPLDSVTELELRFHPMKVDGNKRATPPADLLERFVGLGAEDDVVQFASEFGPLGVWADPEDPSVPVPIGYARQRLSVLGVERFVGPHTESFSWWGTLIVQFNLLWSLTGWVGNRAQPPVDSDLAMVSDLIGDAPWELDPAASVLPDPREWRAASTTQRYMMAREYLHARVNQYVEWSGIRPVLARYGAGGDFEMVYRDAAFTVTSGEGGLSLFGALILQLMQATLGEGGKRCASCGKQFQPDKSPQEKFCSSACRTKGASARTARWRQRKQADGSSPG